MIGVANHEAGINEKLTEKAVVGKLLGQIKAFSSYRAANDPVTEITKRKTMMEARLAQGESRYMDESFVVSLVDDEAVKSFETMALLNQRTLRAIEDQLLHLNMTTEVEISQGHFEYLVRTGVI